MLKVIIFGAALIAVPVFVSIPASADHLGVGSACAESQPRGGDAESHQGGAAIGRSFHGGSPPGIETLEERLVQRAIPEISIDRTNDSLRPHGLP